MPLFRKREMVEAIQFDGQNFFACAKFLGHGDLLHVMELRSTDNPVIHGPGQVVVSVPVGHWIISGEGWFFNMNPDDFSAIYEKVEDVDHVPAG